MNTDEEIKHLKSVIKEQNEQLQIKQKESTKNLLVPD